MPSKAKQIIAALVIAGLVLLTGIVILLVWFLSPSSIELPVKVLITAFLLILWPVGILIVYYSRRRKNARAAAAAGNSAPVSAGNGTSQPGTPTGTYDELSRGAEEAVQ